MSNAYVKELEVTEFHGIKRFKKPLKLRGFNVIIGRNGAGKSTVLEALYMIR
ncbi:MAG TPA: DUF2813 domain-containing protein [Pyrodictium sp.]|nr:DUF2813 domain-containing protein [Pyrodictium sp.]